MQTGDEILDEAGRLRARLADAERRAEEAQRAAEEAVRSKSEFLADVSHEIRTPMNAIIGLTSLVLQSALGPEQAKYLHLVQASAESLLQILDDILDLSKLESGRLDFEQLPFDPREAIERTVQGLTARARARGIELAVELPPDLPRPVQGDARRFRQVLASLLPFALKQAGPGDLTVRASVEGDPSACRLEISLSGAEGSPPLTDEARDRPAARLEEEATSFFGADLALRVARRLAEMMGGGLLPEGERSGVGAFSFQARLPLAEAEEELPTELAGMKVLVLDGSAATRSSLRGLLESFGMEVAEAATGPEGLELLRDACHTPEPYRFLLIDTRPQGSDGFALAEKILGTAAFCAPLVVMTTTGGFEEAVARAGALGIQTCLQKPIRRDELLAALRGSPGETAALGRQEPTEGSAPGLRILVAEDNVINETVVTALLRARGWSTEVVRTGEEAVRATASRDYDLVLMDVQMPNMDGYDATRAIREREHRGGTGRRLPIVGLTAHALRGDREKCLASGMDEYLAKPVAAEALYAWVERFAAVPPRTGPGRPPAKLEKLLKAVGGDRAVLGRLVKTFLEDYPEKLASIRTALQTGDRGQLARAAHSYRGALIIIGAEEATDLSTRLEELAKVGALEEAPSLARGLEDASRRLAQYLAAEAGLATR